MIYSGKKPIRKDLLVVGLITFIYALISFINLGNISAPQSFERIFEGQSIDFYFSKAQDVSRIMFYNGETPGNYRVYYFEDVDSTIQDDLDEKLGNQENIEENVDDSGETEIKSVLLAEVIDTSAFYWTSLDLQNTVVDHLRIEGVKKDDDDFYLGEVGFFDASGQQIQVVGYDDSVETTLNTANSPELEYSLLLDEQDLVPYDSNYMNSTYFDEIYFARTAYEYATGKRAYEWVHPPLGKILQSIPVQILGMTPFAWRLGGNICGILMIPLIYMIADKILKNKKWAVFAALLMALDTFHFAHTRMGTIDSYLVVFCMLESLFMLRYLDGHKKSNLFWSGLFMGCGISTKWSGCFTALGIAILFFVDFFKNLPKTRKRQNEILKLAGICIGSFIILPTILYLGSYMAFPRVTVGYAGRLIASEDGQSYYCDTSSNYIEKIRSGETISPSPDLIANETIDTPLDVACQAKGILDYHTGLTESHPFESPWYSWPFDWKPVWYYAHSVDYYATISGIGNLIIYLLGCFGVIFQIYRHFTKKPKSQKEANLSKPWANLAIIACSFLPYLFIGRAMFFYHYFPTLPFVMVAGAHLIMQLEEVLPRKWFILTLTTLLVFMAAFSICYYPVVSGAAVSSDYVEVLKLLPEWYF